jgi:hypothetical protein
MNNLRKSISFAVIAVAILVSAVAVRSQAQAKPGTDQFFIISSVDKLHSSFILLLPTEITATIAYNDKTKYSDENGKPLKVTDFQTGDSIFVNYSLLPNKTMVATSIRKGMMTTAEMRKRYLPGLPITTSPKGLGH